MGDQPDIPKAPDPSKTYQAGIDVLLKNLPSLLAAEEGSRLQYDPQRIAEQQGLQAQFGPIQTQQQLDQLQQIDPTGQALREQLGGQVSSDLASGYQLPPDFASELENQIRGAQVVRGNTLGAAPASAEALFKGKAAIDLYQQHLDNAGQFLGLQTPEQQITLLSGVQPDRSFSYVDPNAGLQGQQFALGNYQNLLAQNQLATNTGNSWTRALAGAGTGAAQGYAAGGGWGALIGAGAGALGGYYSDARLKENIEEIAKTKEGIPIVRFNYKGQLKACIGVLAQDVIRFIPDAVGFKMFHMELFATVDYAKVKTPFLELEYAGINF
jgi:hypothetical protein